MTGMMLRMATAGDAEQIARVHTLSWQAAYRGLLPDAYLDGALAADMQQKWLARLGAEAALWRVCLAQAGAEVIGFACLQPEAEPEKGVYLDNLHALPTWQGKGVGKRLMAWAAQQVSEGWPQRALFLYVLQGNLAARQLYLRWQGIETMHQDVPLPGNVTLPVCQVCWQDVAGLAALLQRRG